MPASPAVSNTALFSASQVPGAIFALLAFTLSVMSTPILFDRSIDTGKAILTSLKTVGTNPVAMVIWAPLLAALTAVALRGLRRRDEHDFPRHNLVHRRID